MKKLSEFLAEGKFRVTTQSGGERTHHEVEAADHRAAENAVRRRLKKEGKKFIVHSVKSHEQIAASDAASEKFKKDHARRTAEWEAEREANRDEYDKMQKRYDSENRTGMPGGKVRYTGD